MSLKANIVANYLGQGWRALMALAFVPVYIRYLGVEAYGLIGLFVTLQAWLGLLDLGLRPVLSREMSRFTGGAHDAQSIADLLRSIELVALAIALFFAGILWLGSGWLATDWVRTETLPKASVAQAFALMGLVAALQFIESLYTSGLSGLQRQVLQNGIASIIATLRGLGAVAVLIWVSPTIEAFFVWQGVVSLISLLLFAGALYQALPRPGRRARFSAPSLAAVRAYAGGMIGITLLSFLLTQIDKILLSRQLPLDAFAQYMLAGVVAGSMAVLASPVGAAYYPRFTELVARADTDGLRRAYHQGAQITSVLLGSAGLMLIVFGDRLLLHWTQDATLAREVTPLLSLIAIGTVFNGLMSVPYLLQLAHGWTSLSIKINCIAVALLVPAKFWVVPRYGAIGAATIWAVLNIGYVLVGAHFMFDRLLRTDRWAWYVHDVSLPLVAAALAALALRVLMPASMGFAAELTYLAAAGLSIAAAAGLASPIGMAQVKQRVWKRARPLRSKVREGRA